MVIAFLLQEAVVGSQSGQGADISQRKWLTGGEPAKRWAALFPLRVSERIPRPCGSQSGQGADISQRKLSGGEPAEGCSPGVASGALGGAAGCWAALAHGQPCSLSGRADISGGRAARRHTN